MARDSKTVLPTTSLMLIEHHRCGIIYVHRVAFLFQQRFKRRRPVGGVNVEVFQVRSPYPGATVWVTGGLRAFIRVERRCLRLGDCRVALSLQPLLLLLRLHIISITDTADVALAVRISEYVDKELEQLSVATTNHSTLLVSVSFHLYFILDLFTDFLGILWVTTCELYN